MTEDIQFSELNFSEIYTLPSSLTISSEMPRTPTSFELVSLMLSIFIILVIIGKIVERYIQ